MDFDTYLNMYTVLKARLENTYMEDIIKNQVDYCNEAMEEIKKRLRKKIEELLENERGD